MAVVRFGGVISGIRGTIGGVTFSANGTACYAKSWARPPAMNSEKQRLCRARLVLGAVAWAALDQGDKDAWDAFAADPNEMDYDFQGDQRFITGFQWFTRCASRRIGVGLEVSATPPSGVAATAVTGFGLTIYGGGAGGSVVSWDGSQFIEDDSAVVVMSFSPRTGGADSWVNWKQVLAKYDPGDTGESVDAEYRAAFGDLSVGWKCWARIYKQAFAGNRSVAASASTILE